MSSPDYQSACHHPHKHLSCGQRHPQRHQRLRRFWGLVLLVAGSLLLLHQFDLLPFLSWPQWAGSVADYGIGHLFAALLLLSGLSHWFSRRDARGVWKGFVRVALATWLFTCLQQLAGLTFANSWPLLIILFGLGVLLPAGGIRVRVNSEGEQ